MLHSQHHMIVRCRYVSALRAEFPSWCNRPRGHLQLRRTRRESLLPHIRELTMLPSLYPPFRRADVNLIQSTVSGKCGISARVRPACRAVSVWPAPGACMLVLACVSAGGGFGVYVFVGAVAGRGAAHHALWPPGRVCYG
jgi:hypothetical protein